MKHQTCTSCADRSNNNNVRSLAPRQLHPPLETRATPSESSYIATPAPAPYIRRKSSYIATPAPYILRRNLIINVKNINDHCCVLYATLAKQLWQSLKGRRTRSIAYKPYLSTLKTEGLTFPLPLHQMERYECMNNLTINVYMIEEDGGVFTPVYISKRAQDDPYNFLMIVSKNVPNHWHYAWIKNLDELQKASEEWSRNLVALQCSASALQL